MLLHLHRIYLIIQFVWLTQANKIKWYSYCQFKGINNDILTCDKCLINESTPNTCLFSNNKTIRFLNLSFDNGTISNSLIQRTLPYVTFEWFTYDLGYMLQNSEVLSNFNATELNGNISATNELEEMERNFKIIELNNFGIEILSKNAFEKFVKLKVLRLNSNLINTVDFSSFMTNVSSSGDDTTDTQKSQLIELDLSNNQIKAIKIENLMYFENLKILNLSRNFIKTIDLRLVSLVAPNLQVFDISNNFIQKFSLLNSSSKPVQTALGYFHALQLTFNYLLKDLIYINLSGNMLSSVLEMFSINEYLIQNQLEFCNLPEFNQNQFFKRNSPIYLNIRSNEWKCDCSSFGFLTSIINNGLIQQRNESSCLTQIMFKKLNIFSINQHQNIEALKNISCYHQARNATNWQAWHKAQCLKAAIDESANTTVTIATTLQYNLIWLSNSVGTSKHFNTTIKMMLKYDVTSAFYWVSSVCVAIVTVSCLFVAWFYCWKRFRMKRRGMLDTNSAASTNPISLCRSNTARCRERRNIYLINSRLSNDHQQPTQLGSQIVRNARYTNTPTQSTPNRNITGLYYISLNRDSNSLDSNNSPNFSLTRDDEPPNYYEVIKNNKNNLNKNSSNQRTLATAATAASSSSTAAVINITNDETGQSTDV